MTRPTTSVHLLSLGCARNDVDSEELAARLAAGGFTLAEEADEADAIVVNTCGFIEAAKQDSVNALLAAADLRDHGRPRAVVALGCLAERYGRELADSLPEADAVLGFDDYADIAARLRWIMDGGRVEAHTPTDRRTLLPLAPSARPDAAAGIALPGHAHVHPVTPDAPDLQAGRSPASGPRPVRRRLGGSPYAPLKIASGCDRRCAFCAIPSFRGAFVSRAPDEIVAEAHWLAGQGVREVMLVSENSSSYGKDLGEPRALERLLERLSGVDGLHWIRVSYLQPAEVRPGLIEAMCAIDKVVPYFDLSFQHAAAGLLRRMRRFGDADSFLGLIDRIRALQPDAGIRSNVIVGFPGESEQDLEVLLDFVAAARPDALGVFGYSDEEGTEGALLPDKVAPELIAERVERVSAVVDEVINQRAEDRVGKRVEVLVECVAQAGVTGRAAHQGPEVDGATTVPDAHAVTSLGTFVWGRVTATDGVDLIAEEVSPDGRG